MIAAVLLGSAPVKPRQPNVPRGYRLVNSGPLKASPAGWIWRRGTVPVLGFSAKRRPESLPTMRWPGSATLVTHPPDAFIFDTCRHHSYVLTNVCATSSASYGRR
jgi:hypothetical protein